MPASMEFDTTVTAGRRCGEVGAATMALARSGSRGQGHLSGPVGLRITSSSAALRPGWLSGWSVAEGDDTGAKWPGFEELERHLAGGSLKQVLAGAGHERVDQQGEFVKQSLLKQELDKG